MGKKVIDIDNDPELAELLEKQAQLFAKKPHLVKAVQMQEAFRVRTPSGVANGRAGDWLIMDEDDWYPCSGERFEALFDFVVR